MRAGVIQIFALEPDLRAARMLRQATGVVHRAGTADVVLEVGLEFGDESRIVAHALILRAQLVEGVHQRLGDEYAPIRSEVALCVGKVVSL